MKNKDNLYLSLYFILKFFIIFMPHFILNFLALITARITFYLNKKHRKIIDTNLQICFPAYDKKKRDKIALKIYKNFAQLGIDCLKNQNTTKEKILNKVQFINENFLTQALANKRPIIFTTAHYGNWEILSLAYAAKYGPISIVGKKLKSEVMYKILSQNRTQFNIQLIDKKGGLKQMLSALKRGRSLGLLTDQDCTDNESIKISFFNKEVNYQMGASFIAQKSDALIIPVYVYKNKFNQFCIEFFKSKDPRNTTLEELTLYQAQTCEAMIKKRPWEYFFFHRRFASYSEELYK
ncbi:lipid A biosynthesis lauroyl acyltransferase [Campylobacter hepaticus]|uniref:lipid A biosynthesis lauroyl acyltransferase n=1 Tax=Campylobacter hepaticus TaxID=1813019 RepID=UPI0029A07588|nr:lipid A biosynthesis lauroyl acyltransferase [Campylobacter hepaticus]MDX2330652.1 lipid A biosynthesis lauroyl acyltransferase [Campylobacter hepaticus]MDX2371269.1 lipid A biosynthesis lauroyl acyltransferase [Campylobacter hepaticus]MDX2397085.1 lipid A biosynthesis lauroyl acyltransferase [Campylobacter hepaticus]MDX5508426.1 lipid A biosynthesis lauroyl acyltransferase [Campylobacter hepaticus]